MVHSKKNVGYTCILRFDNGVDSKGIKAVYLAKYMFTLERNNLHGSLHYPNIKKGI